LAAGLARILGGSNAKNVLPHADERLGREETQLWEALSVQEFTAGLEPRVMLIGVISPRNNHQGDLLQADSL
jgi:hypothetical protein